jgi:hypothetical protein
MGTAMEIERGMFLKDEDNSKHCDLKLTFTYFSGALISSVIVVTELHPSYDQSPL